MPMHPYIVYPEASSSAALSARQVAVAYNYPLADFTGAGATVGIVELGGAYHPADLAAFCKKYGLTVPSVTVVLVDGAPQVSDPQGADGEVALDVQLVAAVAPGAKIRVYFGPNTDNGFLHAYERAAAECNVVSISWGGPENSWSASALDAFNTAFLAARNAGVATTVAAGDNGSSDGTSGTVVDFPSSSPNAVGCGGTRLVLDASGARASEVVWNDNPSNDATGGGVSQHFPGRDVPDVAGNADPQSGYEVVIGGQWQVIGGTSAVAPLYAGLLALVFQATGSVPDVLKTVPANPTVCFDVTSGSNGVFRAGPGRDENTGFGVVDGERFLSALGAPPVPVPVPTPVPVPVPGPPPSPTPAPVPTPVPVPVDPVWASWVGLVEPSYKRFVAGAWGSRKPFVAALKVWHSKNAQ